MGVGKSKEKAPIKDRKADEKSTENVEFKGMKKVDENDPENKQDTLGRNKRGTLTRMSGTLTRGKNRVTTLLKNVFPGSEKKKEEGASNEPAAAATNEPPAVNGHVDEVQANNQSEEVKVVVEQHTESKPEPAPRKNKKQLRDEFFRMEKTPKVDPFPPSPAKLRAQKPEKPQEAVEALVPPPRKRKTSKEERESAEAEAMAAAAAIDAAVQSKDGSPELNGQPEVLHIIETMEKTAIPEPEPESFVQAIPEPEPVVQSVPEQEPFIEQVSQSIAEKVMEAIPQAAPFVEALREPESAPSSQEVDFNPIAPPRRKKSGEQDDSFNIDASAPGFQDDFQMPEPCVPQPIEVSSNIQFQAPEPDFTAPELTKSFEPTPFEASPEPVAEPCFAAPPVSVCIDAPGLPEFGQSDQFSAPSLDTSPFEPSFEAEVSAPQMSAPLQAALPSFEAPSVDVPSVDIDVPSVEVPSVDVPSFEAPSVDVPSVDIDVPSFEAPSVDVPSFEAPSVDVPSVDIDVPSVEIPSVDVPSVDVDVPSVEAVEEQVDGLMQSKPFELPELSQEVVVSTEAEVPKDPSDQAAIEAQVGFEVQAPVEVPSTEQLPELAPVDVSPLESVPETTQVELEKTQVEIAADVAPLECVPEPQVEQVPEPEPVEAPQEVPQVEESTEVAVETPIEAASVEAIPADLLQSGQPPEAVVEEANAAPVEQPPVEETLPAGEPSQEQPAEQAPEGPAPVEVAAAGEVQSEQPEEPVTAPEEPSQAVEQASDPAPVEQAPTEEQPATEQPTEAAPEEQVPAEVTPAESVSTELPAEPAQEQPAEQPSEQPAEPTPTEPAPEEQIPPTEEQVPQQEEVPAEAAPAEESPKQESSTVSTEFIWPHGGNDVLLLGSFNEWKEQALTQDNGIFKAVMELPEGSYTYKYKVDGEWKVNPDQLSEGENNIVVVQRV